MLLELKNVIFIIIVIITLPHNVTFAHTVDVAGTDFMFLENSTFQNGRITH